MAKLAVINRNNKRKAIVKKFAERRNMLLNIINNYDVNEEQRVAAKLKLQKLPRDSCPLRIRNRCEITGRPRGVYSKFGLGRIKLRDIAMSGMIPGMVKASW